MAGLPNEAAPAILDEQRPVCSRYCYFLAFAFLAAGCALVVVSSVLIVVLLCVDASDDTFITLVGNECEAKEREKR
jgi:hypothetical protein